MGFAWELANNVRSFGMPEVWDYPPPSPRHRKPRTPRGGVAALVRGAVIAARRARAVLTTWPALADHRRAF